MGSMLNQEEESMNGNGKTTKVSEKPAKNARQAKAETKSAGLEPCAKPQANEAERIMDIDDACDDGVN